MGWSTGTSNLASRELCFMDEEIRYLTDGSARLESARNIANERIFMTCNCEKLQVEED